MKTDSVTSHVIGLGAMTIRELGADIQHPVIVIMQPWFPGDNDISPRPAVSLELRGNDVWQLYQALHKYYESSKPETVDKTNLVDKTDIRLVNLTEAKLRRELQRCQDQMQSGKGLRILGSLCTDAGYRIQRAMRAVESKDIAIMEQSLDELQVMS